MSFQMGLAMASAFDPETRQNTPVIGTAHLGMVTLIFLLLDGHHMLIRSLSASLESFPVGTAIDSGFWTEILVDRTGAMYAVGARVAGPVTGIMMLVNASLGFLNRVAPQFSVFSFGFPITIMSGLLSLIFVLPEVGSFFTRTYTELVEQMALITG